MARKSDSVATSHEVTVLRKIVAFDLERAENDPHLPDRLAGPAYFDGVQRKACFDLLEAVGRHHLFGASAPTSDSVSRNRIFGALAQLVDGSSEDPIGEISKITHLLAKSAALVKDGDPGGLASTHVSVAFKSRLRIFAVDLAISVIEGGGPGSTRVYLSRSDTHKIAIYRQKVEELDAQMRRSMGKMLNLFPVSLVEWWKEYVAPGYRPLFNQHWFARRDRLARARQASGLRSTQKSEREVLQTV